MSVQQEAVPTADVATSLLGRPYRLSDTYEVGREKIREFARAVQDHHLAHYDVRVARALGHDGLVHVISSSRGVAHSGHGAFIDISGPPGVSLHANVTD